MPLKFRPKLEKIVELLLYLAEKRPNSDKYQAVKFLYLADREHFNRYGRPITFDMYYALRYGPVGSNAMDLLKGDPRTLSAAGLEDLPFRTEEVEPSPGEKKLLYIREQKRAVDMDVFSKSDVRVFDEIIAKYGDCTFQQLYDITHDHFAYKDAWENRGWLTRRAEMDYAKMIEDEKKRERVIDDLEPVSANM